MTISKVDLYKRQTTLPEIGEKGQIKLQDAEVIVIGCGGLGGSVAVHLAASGIGHIHLIDYDEIAISNLHRQVFYKLSDVGEKKSKTLAAYLKEISPFVRVSWEDQPIRKSTIDTQLKDYSLIIDCTDSLITKYLLNDYCVINDKMLIYGSLYKHDGYVSSFNLKQGQKRSANMRDAFPELPKKSIPNCSEIGTLNPIVGIIAMFQANEVIKIILGIGKPLFDRVLIYNSMQNSQYSMKLTPKVFKEEIKGIFKSEQYVDFKCEIQDVELLISSDTLKTRLKEVEIVSVIDNSDTPIPFQVNQYIPYSKFALEQLKIPKDKDLVVVCNKGISSYEIVKKIRSAHPDKPVFSLSGGIEKFQNIS